MKLITRLLSLPDAPRPSADAVAGRPVDPAPPSDEGKREWLELWDADWDSVAETGRHIGSLMWSDDGVVGRRGWYY